MHIITRKRILEAKMRFPEAAKSFDAWLRIMRKNKFENFAALRATFRTVDKVGNLYVFDIGGNKIRLIASIHFNRQKIYIRHIITHKEYDKDTWKKAT